MRRADCAPLVGRRRGPMQLSSWEGIADLRKETAEREGGNRRELYQRLLAYGMRYCLTQPQQEAVELCCIQGLTATQAAQQLGMHPSAMSRRLNRAVTRLKNLAQ